MTDEQIFKKLEKMYESEGGKKFISHLIRSFFPVHKSEFIWEKKDKPMKCCITGDSLLSKDEIFQSVMDMSPDDFANYLKISFDPENQEPVEHPIRKKLGNKILGIECKSSDKLLCKQAFDQLYNFYATKLINGDGYMNWLSKRMMAEAGISSFRDSGTNITKTEEKTIIKSIDKPRKTTFGDLEVLKQLLDKFKE